MIYVEFEGEFDEQEALGILEEVVNRLIIDPETGEILGMLDGDGDDMDSDVTVKVPDHIIEWAKKEPQ